MAAAVAALVISASASVCAETVEAPSRWIGRIDASTGRFAWPGSGLEFTFTGTRLEVVLRDGGENSLMIEGAGEPRRLDLAAGRHSYLIARNLEDSTHRVRLLRRTEGSFGPTAFVEATTDGVFVPADAPKRQILVIGDSISAGYGIEGESRDCRFSADTENQYLTYAAVAARGFGAETVTLAISGRGVTRNFDGSMRATMPEVMTRTIPGEAGSAGLLPRARGSRDGTAVIVVHLGTNDFGGGKRPAGFVQDYTALLERLREDHPAAFIYAALGPMLAPADFAAAEAAITLAVAARHRADDAALRYLRFTPVDGGLGCDWHPNVKAHRHMARQLTEAIVADLGWRKP